MNVKVIDSDGVRDGVLTSDERGDVIKMSRCEHSASGNGFVFVCDLPAGHKGLHAQRTQLRDGPSTTNWGDDGLAPHATKTIDQTFSKEA